jgi:hypothetical protein
VTKTFLDQHPPRVNWDKLRKGPTPADLADVPAVSKEEWLADGYTVMPLPDDIAQELERRNKTPQHKGTAAE